MITDNKKYFGFKRKQIYASINSRKGAFMALKTNTFLRKSEKELLDKIIDSIEELRIVLKYNGKD